MNKKKTDAQASNETFVPQNQPEQIQKTPNVQPNPAIPAANIISTLVAIQQELHVPKSQFNEFAKYKFRSAEDILENLKPILRKYNSTLILSDKTNEISGFIYIESTATLITPNGTFQCQASAGVDVNRKGMDLSQCFGAATSYSRKFALSGLLLLDSNDGKDADALNKHDVNEKKLPSLKNETFDAIVKRYNSGEKDVFEKAAKFYTLSTQQQNEIKKLQNEI